MYILSKAITVGFTKSHMELEIKNFDNYDSKLVDHVWKINILIKT